MEFIRMQNTLFQYTVNDDAVHTTRSTYDVTSSESTEYDVLTPRITRYDVPSSQTTEHIPSSRVKIQRFLIGDNKKCRHIIFYMRLSVILTRKAVT